MNWALKLHAAPSSAQNGAEPRGGSHELSQSGLKEASMFKHVLIGSRVSVIYGKRAGEIVKFAAKQSVDLIVMSSHKPNLNNPSRDFGTISHRVAIIAPCAVLLVK